MRSYTPRGWRQGCLEADDTKRIWCDVDNPRRLCFVPSYELLVAEKYLRVPVLYGLSLRRNHMI